MELLSFRLKLRRQRWGRTWRSGGRIWWRCPLPTAGVRWTPTPPGSGQWDHRTGAEDQWESGERYTHTQNVSGYFLKYLKTMRGISKSIHTPCTFLSIYNNKFQWNLLGLYLTDQHKKNHKLNINDAWFSCCASLQALWILCKLNFLLRFAKFALIWPHVHCVPYMACF